MESEIGNLSESILFTKGKAQLLYDIKEITHESGYYSSRIHDSMKRKSETGMSEKDSEIEASKTHWTEVQSNFYNTPATSAREESSTSETGGESSGEGMTEELTEVRKENLEEIRRLQMENEAQSRFFQIGGELTGEPIAIGGQADIYDGGLKRYVAPGGQVTVIPIVMKVSKVLKEFHCGICRSCGPLIFFYAIIP